MENIKQKNSSAQDIGTFNLNEIEIKTLTDNKTLVSKIEFGTSEKEIVFHNCRVFHFQVNDRDGSLETWKCENCLEMKRRATFLTKDKKFLRLWLESCHVLCHFAKNSNCQNGSKAFGHGQN